MMTVIVIMIVVVVVNWSELESVVHWNKVLSPQERF